MSNAELYRAFRELSEVEKQRILDWLDAMIAEPACTCEVEAYLKETHHAHAR